jgi:hypothetical protein
MILFDVKCAKGHVFDAWFRDSGSADRQIAGRQLACPECGNTKRQGAPRASAEGREARRGARRNGGHVGQDPQGAW